MISMGGQQIISEIKELYKIKRYEGKNGHHNLAAPLLGRRRLQRWT